MEVHGEPPNICNRETHLWLMSYRRSGEIYFASTTAMNSKGETAIVTAEQYMLRTGCCLFPLSMDGRKARRPPSPKTGMPCLMTSCEYCFTTQIRALCLFRLRHRLAAWCSDQHRAGAAGTRLRELRARQGHSAGMMRLKLLVH